MGKTQVDRRLGKNNRHEENSRLSEWLPNFVGPYLPDLCVKRPRCIFESDWEDTATQQMPQTSSPIPDDSQENLKKLETEIDEDTDEIDYRARPVNDRRKHKPILGCRPTLRKITPKQAQIWLAHTSDQPRT